MDTAVIFPGQGTQVPYLGDPWRNTPAWRVVDEAEVALGRPLAYLILEASEADLARTREAQMAVLLSSLLAWDAVRERIEPPVAFAGHSLGQITALIASGALSLGEGVRLAWTRAECTQAAADGNPGRMAALIGADMGQAEATCGDPGRDRSCWVANDNAPGQIVLGGTPAGLEAAVGRAGDLGVRRVVPLKVGAAFHTPLMAEASAALDAHLGDISFSEPTAPVVCNVDARAHTDSRWHARLGAHLVSTVRWRQSMDTLVDLGAETFLEVGPGAVLSGLARRSVAQVSTRTFSCPEDLSSLLEVTH